MLSAYRLLGSPDVLIVQADVSQEEGCKHAVDTSLRHFRRRKSHASFDFSLFVVRILVSLHLRRVCSVKTFNSTISVALD